jgi:hypothetical protein
MEHESLSWLSQNLTAFYFQPWMHSWCSILFHLGPVLSFRLSPDIPNGLFPLIPHQNSLSILLSPIRFTHPVSLIAFQMKPDVIINYLLLGVDSINNLFYNCTLLGSSENNIFRETEKQLFNLLKIFRFFNRSMVYSFGFHHNFPREYIFFIFYFLALSLSWLKWRQSIFYSNLKKVTYYFAPMLICNSA